MNDDKNLYFESKKQKENEKPGIHNDKGIHFPGRHNSL